MRLGARPERVIYGQVHVYLADSDARALDVPQPRVERLHLNPGMLKANRLVAEASLFGSRNPERLWFFQTMGTQAPLWLERQIDIGLLLCGGPETVLTQLRRLRDQLDAGVVSLDFNRGDPPATRIEYMEVAQGEPLVRRRPRPAAWRQRTAPI